MTFMYRGEALLYFNPRTREGCDAFFVRDTTRYPDFNPRTREGCDDGRRLAGHRFVISIHAPVKGATGCLATLVWSCLISIHAPVKGATRWGSHASSR